MENQHKKIKGYRDLSQEEIDMMNEMKEHGEALAKTIDKLSNIDGLDHRWISIGKTDLQKGIMSVVRGIAQPESF